MVPRQQAHIKADSMTPASLQERRLDPSGLSQDDLAYEAEVSRSHLSQLEKGVLDRRQSRGGAGSRAGGIAAVATAAPPTPLTFTENRGQTRNAVYGSRARVTAPRDIDRSLPDHVRSADGAKVSNDFDGRLWHIIIYFADVPGNREARNA